MAQFVVWFTERSDNSWICHCIGSGVLTQLESTCGRIFKLQTASGQSIVFRGL